MKTDFCGWRCERAMKHLSIGVHLAENDCVKIEDVELTNEWFHSKNRCAQNKRVQDGRWATWVSKGEITPGRHNYRHYSYEGDRVLKLTDEEKEKLKRSLLEGENELVRRGEENGIDVSDCEFRGPAKRARIEQSM